MSINDDAKKEFLKGESWIAIPDILDGFEKTEEIEKTQKILRMIRLHAYISQLAEVVDPDLVPTSAWGNAQEEANDCHEQLDSNDASEAMLHMDKILAAIAPFATNSKGVAIAAGQAFGKYKNAVNDAFGELEQAKEEVNQLKTKLEASINEINEKLEEVKKYCSELFEGNEEETSKESQIDDLLQKIENYHGEIKEYHTELFGDSKNTSDVGE